MVERRVTPIRRARMQRVLSDKVFDAIVWIFLTVVSILVLYPLIYVVSASFSSAQAVMAGRVWFLPVEFSVSAYDAVFKNSAIMTGYMNSFLYMVLGTSLNIVMTLLCAFCLSRKEFFGRGIMGGMLVFTMFFSGGLIPTYLLIRDLGWLNTVTAMIIPNAMNAWYVILMRSFMNSAIPEDLYESANLDGCTPYGMLWRITVPLSGSIIAVVALYVAVGIWNSYFDAFIYLTNKDLYPLQVVLRNILILNQMDFNVVQDLRELATRQGMSNLIKYAIIVVSSAPLLLLYPFVQRFFVKGIMIGSLKG